MSYPSSIRCRDSSPRPLECESPPITTRPGLPVYSLLEAVVHKKTYWYNSLAMVIKDLLFIISRGNKCHLILGFVLFGSCDLVGNTSNQVRPNFNDLHMAIACKLPASVILYCWLCSNLICFCNKMFELHTFWLPMPNLQWLIFKWQSVHFNLKAFRQ